jgi:hypothetical protein
VGGVGKRSRRFGLVVIGMIASGRRARESWRSDSHDLHERVRLLAADLSWEGAPGDLLIIPIGATASTRWKIRLSYLTLAEK